MIPIILTTIYQKEIYQKKIGLTEVLVRYSVVNPYNFHNVNNFPRFMSLEKTHILACSTVKRRG